MYSSNWKGIGNYIGCLYRIRIWFRFRHSDHQIEKKKPVTTTVVVFCIFSCKRGNTLLLLFFVPDQNIFCFHEEIHDIPWCVWLIIFRSLQLTSKMKTHRETEGSLPLREWVYNDHVSESNNFASYTQNPLFSYQIDSDMSILSFRNKPRPRRKMGSRYFLYDFPVLHIQNPIT